MMNTEFTPEVYILSKSRKSKKSKLAFIDKVLDLSMRGDISGFLKMLKGYWEDKSKYPWHLTYKLIATNWEKEKTNDVGDALIQLRDGIFGALDIHSLSLALDTPTSEILKLLLKGKTWNTGRKNVRKFCAKRVNELVENGQLDFLEPESLMRDGFGYIIKQVTSARLDQYKNASPKVKDKNLDLTDLHKSVHGRLLLRELSITAKSVPINSDEAKSIKEAYDHRLIELETDINLIDIPTGPTEQLTLEGEPVEEEVVPKEEEKKKPTKSKKSKQADLTEYMSGKTAARKRAKKKRAGKRGA